MKTIIASYPAYDVVEATMNKNGVKSLRAETKLVLKQLNSRDPRYQHLHKFMISSVASSAIQDNNCPIQAIERAVKNGHNLHFIFGLDSCITSHKQERKEYVEVSIGDKVYFEGRLFEIQAANNDNLHLKELESEGHSLMTIKEV